MNTFTLNHNYISNDLLFVAASDRICADLLDSYNMDRRLSLDVSAGTSLGTKLKHIFLGK